MNIELFIARRILKNNKQSFTTPVVQISILSIAICVAVIILAISIVSGFKQAIHEKIIGFGSHITITNFDANISYEASPINSNRTFIKALKSNTDIAHIQVFAFKAGVIRANNEIQGVVLKGVDKNYDWSFFKENLKQGTILNLNDTSKSNDIMISQTLAYKLKLKLHDKFDMFFIQDPPRMRKFKIAGIFNSGMETFDNLYLIADIRHIQKLNDWNPNQVAGFEVLLHDFNKIDKVGDFVYQNIDSDLNSQTIKERYPQLFDWLSLIDTNGIVILVLMLAVAIITMISTLLILILERTNMIGILKAIGSSDKAIQQIFIIKALYITGLGIIWGNVFGIAVCLIQKYFHVLQLDQVSYYVSYVPIQFNWMYILFINIGTLVTGLVVLLIPSVIISKIKPIKAIRYN